ncbi:hypothetical protein PG996_004480 [Apiospora saccharicola]|uniref:RING-type domain-containing protein n=1 Tax=Apiospora saccharicola TaxID=335842 RepID=A0ABR1W492_9PEZI
MASSSTTPDADAVTPDSIEHSQIFSEYVAWMRGERGPQDQHHLCTKCCICLDNVLDIAPAAAGDTWGSLVATDHDHSKHSYEATALLLCGHLVGNDCREAQAEFALGRVDECPLCRQKTECARCALPLKLECVTRRGGGPGVAGQETLSIRSDAPLPAVDARTGKPKRVYCRPCSDDTHRANREYAADLLLRERLQMVARLLYPSLDTMWDRDRAAVLEAEYGAWRVEFPSAILLHENPTIWRFLKSRIFGHCTKTKDVVDPMGPKEVAALTITTKILGAEVRARLQESLAWVTDVDDLMAIDPRRPAPINRAMFAMFMGAP